MLYLRHPLFQASGHYPPTRGLTYTVLPSRVKNLAQYGVPVKDLCRAVPTYFAQQQKEGVFKKQKEEVHTSKGAGGVSGPISKL